jgi:hypothetical protein
MEQLRGLAATAAGTGDFTITGGTTTAGLAGTTALGGAAGGGAAGGGSCGCRTGEGFTC